MKNKAVIISLALLLLLAGTTFYFMRAKTAANEDGLVIMADGEEAGIISHSRIKNMPAEQFPYTLKINGQKEQHDFTGTPLRYVLEACDPALVHDYNQVVVTARDGYSISYKMTEVLEQHNVYLIYAMDGEKLKSMEKGGLGPFATVVLKDEFAQRAGKYVVNLEVIR